MMWHRLIAWLAALPCRFHGHRWVELARNPHIAPENVMCARCCGDCGCGQIVNFVHRGVYGAGGIFLIHGRACTHAQAGCGISQREAAEPPSEHLHYCSRCRRRGRKEGAREAKREAVELLRHAVHRLHPISKGCPQCVQIKEYIAAAEADAAEEGKP
jgi:hypothetical protein